MKEIFEKVKRASKSLALLSDQQRNDILNAVADAILNNKVRCRRRILFTTVFS